MKAAEHVVDLLAILHDLAEVSKTIGAFLEAAEVVDDGRAPCSMRRNSVARKTAWCSAFSMNSERIAAHISAAVAPRWWTRRKISGLTRVYSQERM